MWKYSIWHTSDGLINECNLLEDSLAVFLKVLNSVSQLRTYLTNILRAGHGDVQVQGSSW